MIGTVSPAVSPLVQNALYVVTAVVLLAWLWQYVAYKKRQTKWLAGVPGLEYPLPLLGHLYYMMGSVDGMLQRGLDVYHRFGPGPIKFWIGETPSVQVNELGAEPAIISRNGMFLDTVGEAR